MWTLPLRREPAKRLGAKAVVSTSRSSAFYGAAVELRADAKPRSCRSLLRAASGSSPKTQQRRNGLLLVPFTPEELVATVDRAIEDVS